MPFDLTIVTPQGEAYHGAADSIVLPGTEGDFGVLPDHERFLTPLRVGVAEIRVGSETRWAAIADGFAEVRGESVTVLAESCELASDIDAARAERARDRAEQGLAQLDEDAETEHFQAFERALERARNRLEVGRRAS